MKASLRTVIDKLKKAKRRGITWDDFQKGKDLRKRISEARALGWQIHSEWERLSSECRRVRYILIKEPTQQA